MSLAPSQPEAMMNNANKDLLQLRLLLHYNFGPGWGRKYGMRIMRLQVYFKSEQMLPRSAPED